MKRVLIYLIFPTLVLLNTDFNAFKAEMESKVAMLASEMDIIFSKRCDSNIATCQVLSYNECQGTSTKKCFDQFPKPSECLDGGAYMSESSAMRFPNSVNTGSLSNEEKQFVCTSAFLEDKFKQLDTGRQKRYGKAYIGTSLGSFRSYPTTRQDDGSGQCPDYDPRFRPWYVTAASGSKNVILMIDTSGSMSGSRLTLAKDAATAVINTLSNNDFVGVINFGSTASRIHSQKIIRATASDKQSINNAIDGLSANGQTNYQNAFENAFAMLASAQNDEYGAPCSNGENIFLFLTDGEPTVGHTTAANLKTLIDSYNTDITLFTYALGSGASTSILQELSCAYKGIMFQIQDSSSDSLLATTMRNYYSYISEGVEITQPVWTQPYEDAFGFGRMVTVSMPIYYQESGIRTILGVAGIDILMEQIYFGYSEEEVISRLIVNAPCLVSNLTDCQIEDLRSTKCGVVGCPVATTISSCSETAGNIFLTAEDTGTYKCCGLTIGALVGIVVGVAVVIIIVVIVVVCKYRKAKAQRQAARVEEVPQQNNSNRNSWQNPYRNQMQNQYQGGYKPNQPANPYLNY